MASRFPDPWENPSWKQMNDDPWYDRVRWEEKRHWMEQVERMKRALHDSVAMTTQSINYPTILANNMNDTIQTKAAQAINSGTMVKLAAPSYKQLAAIDVNKHTEKKNGLTYLSWAWALDQLYRLDQDASFVYGEPAIYQGTMMVFCTVRAFGRARTAHLPVMNYKNQPIQHPDAMQINTAMQRCLAKAIALHGIGLYIYAGEDVPEDENTDPLKPETKQESVEKTKAYAKAIAMSEIMIPDTITDEGQAVDFIHQFMTEWIQTVTNVTELREFWKVNKSALSRVEKFSQPKFAQLETAFKQKAGTLKNAGKIPPDSDGGK